MEEVVGREEALLAVDGRLDAHRELALAGEMMEGNGIRAR